MPGSSKSPSWSRKWPVFWCTPYVVLLSIPGIGIVTAGEFAGEMGPITNYANDSAITGRAGIYPSRYQSDKVDRCDGPLVRRANRKLRGVIMMIADNLLTCNRFFQTLKERWVAAGVDQRAMCVRVAKRFCRIAYQMVAGGQVFRHPSCQSATRSSASCPASTSTMAVRWFKS
jgi:hypothetical protein